MNVSKYLDSWGKKAKSNSNYSEYEDYEEVYKEIAGFLADQIKLRGLPREAAVNMCFSLLVNQLVRAGICPACEFHAASDTIHEEMGCPNVH